MAFTSTTNSILHPASTDHDSALGNIWGGILPPEYSMEAKKLSEMGLPQGQWLDYLVSKGIPAPLAMLVKLNAATQAKAGAPTQPPQGTVMDKVISDAQQKAYEERHRLADVIHQTASDQARQGGISDLPVPSTMFGTPGAPQSIGMARGGIVAFDRGGDVQDDLGYDPNAVERDLVAGLSASATSQDYTADTDPRNSTSTDTSAKPTATPATSLNTAPPTKKAAASTSSSLYDPTNDENPALTHQIYLSAIRPTTSRSGTNPDLTGLSKGARGMQDLIDYARNNLGDLPNRESSQARVQAEAETAGLGNEDKRYNAQIQSLIDTTNARKSKQGSYLGAIALLSGAARMVRPGQGGNAFSQVLGGLGETGAEYAKGQAEVEQKAFEAQQQLELSRHNLLNHSEAVNYGLIQEGDKDYKNATTDYFDRLKEYTLAQTRAYEYGQRSEDIRANASLKSKELELMRNPAYDLIEPIAALQKKIAEYTANGDTANATAAANALNLMRDNARKIIQDTYPAAVVGSLANDTRKDIADTRAQADLVKSQLKSLDDPKGGLAQANRIISSGVDKDSDIYKNAVVIRDELQRRRQDLTQTLQELGGSSGSAAPTEYQEGMTASNSSGQRMVYRGGKWVSA